MDNQHLGELPVKPACYFCQSYNIDVKNRCMFCDYGRLYTDNYRTHILGNIEKGED